MTHECPGPLCDAQVGPSRLMCVRLLGPGAQAGAPRRAHRLEPRRWCRHPGPPGRYPSRGGSSPPRGHPRLNPQAPGLRLRPGKPAAGRASVSPHDPEVHPMSTTNLPRGPGLFEITQRQRRAGRDTNVRRLAGAERAPGSALIAIAAWLLAAARRRPAVRQSSPPSSGTCSLPATRTVASIIEALMLDVLMIVFSLLALGLSRAGKSARTERALILACPFGVGYMNTSAADTASPRSRGRLHGGAGGPRRGGRPGRRRDPPSRPGR